jgi:CheY-like chemotaxis protein
MRRDSFLRAIHPVPDQGFLATLPIILGYISLARTLQDRSPTRVTIMSWPRWRAIAILSPRVHSTRILVVDDHLIVRRQLCALLREQPDFDVVCEAADGEEAVRKAEEIRPDVILMDISLPGLDGFAAARHIKRHVPSAEILFVSQHDTRQMVREALRAGGRGYVSKIDAMDELVPAVHAVSRRQEFISPRLAAEL